MKGKPTVVTPTATIGTPNPFAALAEAEAEDTTEPAELEISKDKHLPTQVAPESTGPAVTDIVPVPIEDTVPAPFC